VFLPSWVVCAQARKVSLAGGTKSMRPRGRYHGHKDAYGDDQVGKFLPSHAADHSPKSVKGLEMRNL
jgi:hypothetical protein